MKKIIKSVLVFTLILSLLLTGACTPVRYELTISVDPAGAGTVSPGGTYDDGSNVRITATPNEGYEFDGWSGDISGMSTEQTVLMDSNKNVIAHFKSKTVIEKEPVSEAPEEPVYYSLTVRAEPASAGSVTPEQGKFKEGSTVTLVATPNTGYEVNKWDGDAAGISNTVAVTMDSDKEVVVYFQVIHNVTIKKYNLVTFVEPKNGGLVTPSSGAYNTNAKLTLTAMPADNYEFHHWGGDTSGTGETVSFNINEDMAVTAYFEEAGNLTLSSTAFKDEENIPELYSCGGADISPALSWYGVPYGTKSFVLIMDDPDVTQGTFTHWVMYNIPADTRSLAENIPVQVELADGSIQGINNFAEHGYGGPCPPLNQRHEYRFYLYALDINLDISPYAADKSGVTAAMSGHILEQTRISGYYGR